MKDPLFEKSHPFIKLLFLFSIWIISLILLGAVTIFTNTEDLISNKLLTGFSNILMFLLPAVLAAYIYSSSPQKYLYLNKSAAYMFIFAAIIIFFAIPLINYTGMLNSKMSFPEALSGLEKTLKNFELTAEKTTIDFLSVSSYSGLMLNIIIIAIIPALGEELFFRGILLRLFKDWTKNIHIAVIITSVLFSAMHMQFYGFLPRMLLGMLFAYLLVWSGSIWLPIIAHFINNSIAVIVFFYMKDPEILEKTDSFGADKDTSVYLIISTIILVVFLYFFRKAGKEIKEI